MIVIVTTCPRGNVDYLDALTLTIDAGGWVGPRFIVSDGPCAAIRQWRVSASQAGVGQMRTYWRALEIGVQEARKRGDGRITIFEDDVQLCRNALQYIERARIPAALDFITWFDGHVVPPGARPGIYPVPAQYFFCLQGVTWSLATAERLLDSRMARMWAEPHRGDILIARILSGRRYGVHVPNLVQHLGAVSICNPGQGLTGVRTAANYPGPQLDAMDLVRTGSGANGVP